MLPEIVHQPTLHNPFPQISKVAVATFFNASAEPTLDGHKVAEAYAAELAEVPGYVVIPVSQVETAMHVYGLQLEKEQDARRLAQILEVDAVVVGVVTEYTPYYPPRLTMQVQWFAANPNFHPIPAGYGLPWGTAGEKDIPGPLVFQAELALAKEQLKTQTPPYRSCHRRLPMAPAEQVRPMRRPAIPVSHTTAPRRAASMTFARLHTHGVPANFGKLVANEPTNSSANAPANSRHRCRPWYWCPRRRL